MNRQEYEVILERARNRADAAFVGIFARELAQGWRAIYEAMSPRATNIVRFQCGSFEYIYDDYASLEATGQVPYDPVMEARLVAVSGYSVVQGKARGDFRLKGWVGRDRDDVWSGMGQRALHRAFHRWRGGPD